MIPVIVIRPEPGCAATLKAARERGLDARGFPLFAVCPLVWSAPPPQDFDALLIGSANALRHGGAALAAYRGMPAYAVGAATADAARRARLDVAGVGEGELQKALARLRPDHRRLLRLAGEARVTLAPPDGVSITERVVYASRPRPMPEALARCLRDPAVVLLHSGEAARHFASLCDDGGIARAGIRLAAIGPRVAEAAGTGWDEVAVADRPHDTALLALAMEMCQRPAGS